MKCRSVAVAALLAASTLGLPAGATTASEPRGGCASVPDPRGDAVLDLSEAGVPARGAYDRNLDILGVTFRLTSTTLETYLHMASVGGPSAADTYGATQWFWVTFVASGHEVDYRFDRAWVAQPVRDLLPALSDPPQLLRSSFDARSGNDALAHAALTVDSQHGYFIISVPRASFDAVGARLVPGRQLRAVQALDRQGQAETGFEYDRLDHSAAWTIGKNACFGAQRA